jgi:hypothetical protein
VARKEWSHWGAGGEAKKCRENVPASPVGKADEMLAKDSLDASHIRVAHVAKLDSGVPER